MAMVLQITANTFSLFDRVCKEPHRCYLASGAGMACPGRSRFGLGDYREWKGWSLVSICKGEALWRGEAHKGKKRVVLVRSNQGFGFNGGGGGRDNGQNARVLGNLVLAIGLTYLSMTGQLGWVLDAIVSVWLIVVLVPILGLGAFLWWAGRDIVQSSCPNCGNDFQILKSTLDDEVQLCPFCSQPFSVVDDKFVKEPVKFSNQTTMFGQKLNGFSSKKGKDYSRGIVDVEAEVKDIE